MQTLNELLSSIDARLGGSQWFVFLLLGTGLFFTLYLRFPQFRYFRQALRILTGKYDRTHHVGDTSHFQALTTALSGTVGTGNIAGVALAIHLGGPGALFWMLVTAFLGMTTKMVEVTLSHKYREQAADGTIAGGPMYYMKNRLKMRWMASLFAVATLFSAFGTGCLPQINSISNALFSAFGITHWITGALLSVLLGLIILGGIKRIASVSEKLVPFMGIVYFLGCLSVLVFNYQNILPAIGSVFTAAFTGSAATGGFLGGTVLLAFNRGVNRGLFSNEAGQGSAPIAHAAAKAEEPVSEGLVALLEPFIDTLVICFLTGIVLLASGVWDQKFENRFQYADLAVLQGIFHESDPHQREAVTGHLLGTATLPLYSGTLHVENGRIADAVTLLHARSFADSVRIEQRQQPFTGTLSVRNGTIENDLSRKHPVVFSGRSILHSAPLSTEAFKKGMLGKWGEFVVPLSLLLFAFTTAVAWAYYGGRAIIYLWGIRYVKPFYALYVAGFFVASFTDTSLIWTFTGITVALMTLPNLIGLLLLHKEVKQSLQAYDRTYLPRRKTK